MTLRTTISSKISAVQTGANDLANPSFTPTHSYLKELTSGVGANQADQIFCDTRSLAASANESLDLAGGLTDALGNVLTFAKIKALKISAADGNSNSIVVGAAGSNPWNGPLGGTAPTITLPPGGECLLTAPVGGWSVTSGTGDLLKIANSGGGSAVDYTITIVGTSS